jgi:hypothetical protein
MTGEASQLSVAVAVPVAAGVEGALQLMVMFAGQLITGAVISRTVITWLQDAEFPQLSAAVQVRVITKLPAQLPAVVASL